MIVLSVGLPKSGSAWFFLITNELLKAGGYDDALEIRSQYRLEETLKFKTCNIQKPTAEKLALLSHPPIGDHTFTVKSHSPSNEDTLNYMARGLIKTTFLSRDPRDMAVSAFEAGKKQRAQGKKDSFAKLTTITKAIYQVQKWLANIWESWCGVEGIFTARYEDLLDPKQALVELGRLKDFLGLSLEESVLTDISNKWRGSRAQTSTGPEMHFNKGRSGRFREVMTPGELTLCREILTPYLIEMGYPEN